MNEAAALGRNVEFDLVKRPSHFSRTPWSVPRSKSDRRLFRIGVFAAVFWGVGTNLLDSRWYLIHGISIGDILFGGWMLLALARPRTTRLLWEATRRVEGHIMLMTIFVLWLLVSVVINIPRFGAEWSDIFPIVRLCYFSAMIVFCVAFIRRFGPSALITAFLVGVALLTIGRLADAFDGGVPMVMGFPLLYAPNVIGNMLGIGVMLNSLLILQGWTKWPLTLTVAFAVASVMTFSKGAWLMVLLGITANLVALAIRCPLSPRGITRLVASVVALFLVLGSLMYYNAERVLELIAFKYETTEYDDSTGLRYRFALAGLYAMVDHPIVGVGFRNYYVVERLYPELSLVPSDNAHNAFAQVGAVGGVPALVVFLLLFLYAFVQLWKVIRLRNPGVGGIAYVALILSIFVVSGSVQLQLTAQPFFWFFTGVVRGWHCRETELRRNAIPASPFN